MADYDSSLPIRTEAAGDVDVFISDSTTPSQKLKVNADGSIDANISAGSKVIVTDGVDDVAVNADGSLNAVVTAIDLDIRDLAFATDKVDVSGSSVTVSATDLDIRDLAFASDSVTAHQGGSWTVTATATDLDIRDLNAAQDSIAAHLFDEAGVAFSAANPLPVIMASDAEGDEICNYNTSANVAADASVNHDYSVSSGKTLLIEQVWASASGKIKAEFQVNGVTKFVGFNSSANANIEIPVKKLLKGLSAQTVRVIITNLDKQAMDVYSTVSGLEI